MKKTLIFILLIAFGISSNAFPEDNAPLSVQEVERIICHGDIEKDCKICNTNWKKRFLQVGGALVIGYIAFKVVQSNNSQPSNAMILAAISSLVSAITPSSFYKKSLDNQAGKQ